MYVIPNRQTGQPGLSAKISDTHESDHHGGGAMYAREPLLTESVPVGQNTSLITFLADA